MKNILYIHHVSDIGGGSYCLLNIIRELDRTSYKPYVLLKTYGPLVDELKLMGVECLFLSLLSTVPYNRTLFSPRSVLQYLRVFKSRSSLGDILSKYHFDIVYLNNMMLWPYLKVAKSSGAHTIYHVREHWPLNEHKVQLKWARSAVYKYADRLVAINKYSASMFPDKKSTIVYDWVDLETRKSSESLNDLLGCDVSGKKIYLFTGGRSSIKGAFEVCKTFSESVKDPDARLLVLGWTPFPAFKGPRHIVQLILRHFGRLYYNFDLCSVIKKDDRILTIPPTYYIKSILESCYCMVSYFTIPHANLALAEGVISKKVVIAAETEESLEYTNNGKYAILYPFNDIKSFSECLSTVSDRYDEVQTNLLTGSLDVAKMFDREINSKRLSDVYNFVE